MHSFLADEIEPEGYQLLFVPLYISKMQLLHYVLRRNGYFISSWAKIYLQPMRKSRQNRLASDFMNLFIFKI